jgi:L-fuculose-phosphate aldolase
MRQAIIEACRTLERQGINQGMAGNISVRCGEAMLITPTATPYDRMAPEDIARVDLLSSEASGPKRPSSEWRFHRDILVARPEIGAVVHAHPPHCTALAMARRGIPPCHYMIATFGGEDVRCGGYATFGTQALSDGVIEALRDRTACLMANHGMIACGRDLDQALWRAVELEALARQYLASMAAGGPVLLSGSDIADAMRQFEGYRA